MADLAQPILAPKLRDFFLDGRAQWRASRYKVLYGGRGGLKSWGCARMLTMLAAKRRLRVLCGREFQNSIEESVHEVIRGQISLLGLDRYFDVQQRSITSYTGSEFIFSGVRTNPTKIKSMEGIDIFWGEEAEKFSADSLKVIIPTIRKPGSEIWLTLNPDLESDPVCQRFLTDKPPERSLVLKTSWRDNLWLSDELREEKDYLARVDPDAYDHVWEGNFRRNSASQVLKGKYRIEAFEPAQGWDGPYYGADWGFSQDPTTLVRLWVHDRKLYVEHEAYKIGCDIDATPDLFDKVPGAREHVIRADSARPETISYMQRHGYPKVTGVEKWSGSVEDGIAHMRQYEAIVIHPRCRHAGEEARLYSFKTDRLTGDVLTDIVDKHNHIMDAIRYALAPLIRRIGMGFFDFMRQEAEALKAQQQAGN